MKPKSTAQIKEDIKRKKIEIEKLVDQMKEGFNEIGRELKKELGEANMEFNYHR